MSEKKQRVTPKRLRWLSRSLLLAILGAIAVILGGASLTNAKLSSGSNNCGSCHQIQPLVEEWKTSTHKDVACVECHTPPGLAGFVALQANAAKNLAIQAAGQQGPLHASVSDSSCLQCHPRETRPEVINQATLRIAHSKHEGQGCADCHKQIVHSRRFEPQTVASSTVEQVQSRCQTCHKPSQTFVHGSADVACASCHSAVIPNHDLAQKKGVFPMSSCTQCHEKQKVSTPDQCQTCHVSPHGIQQACGQCHIADNTTWAKRTFTHPVELVGKHATLKCDQCHTNGKDFKGLTYTCANCHQPKHEPRANNQCAACHTPQGWRVFGAGSL
ncbi:MAG: NapC/NirT family cytochrome c [Chloroflexi bacterium]|nr:NapC/NirT family cytochrome c [Chloroflexota bacterium]